MIIPSSLNNTQPIIDAQELFINEYYALFWVVVTLVEKNLDWRFPGTNINIKSKLFSLF